MQSECPRGRETRPSGLGSDAEDELGKGRWGGWALPEAQGWRCPARVEVHRTAWEQAENELGGQSRSKVVMARLAHARHAKGSVAEDDPGEGQPCRPGGFSCRTRGKPRLLRSRVSPLGKLQSMSPSVARSLPSPVPAASPFLTSCVTCSPLTRAAVGLGCSGRCTSCPLCLRWAGA